MLSCTAYSYTTIIDEQEGISYFTHKTVQCWTHVS